MISWLLFLHLRWHQDFMLVDYYFWNLLIWFLGYPRSITFLYPGFTSIFSIVIFFFLNLIFLGQAIQVPHLDYLVNPASFLILIRRSYTCNLSGSRQDLLSCRACSAGLHRSSLILLWTLKSLVEALVVLSIASKGFRLSLFCSRFSNVTEFDYLGPRHSPSHNFDALPW